jgi:hypothetical protein
MRKVLLATTALVALGGVSAASADISVSAANEFKYTSWSDNTAETGGVNKTNWNNTTSYEISASKVTDNGLSMSSYILQDGTSDASWDDFGFSITGDFGTVGFEGSESGDAFATAVDVTPDEGNSITTATATTTSYNLPGDEAVDSASISYKSPDISGFQFAFGAKPNGNSDSSSFGAQYAMTSGTTSITVKYAASSAGKATTGAAELEATSVGLVVGYGDATVTYAQNTEENGTYDFTADAIGITYKMSDSITLSAYTGTTDDAKDTTHEVKDTGLGVAYTITPGLVLNVTHNDWSIKDTSITNEDGSHMAVALNLSF